MLKIGFLGQFSHTIDDKGRVSIPSSYRRYMEGTSDSAENKNDIILTIGKKKCVEVFPAETWVKMSAKYSESMTLAGINENDEIRERTRNSAPATIDRSGRIMLPEHLRNSAGLKKELVIIGVVDRFEIWDEAELKKHDEAKNKGGK